MQTHLKVGVVGAGVFGNYHATKVAAHDRTVLTGLYDPNPDRAKDVAERHGGIGFGRVKDLITKSDALIIASPATQHAPVSLAALAEGKHLLVEKPLSPDPEAAQAIANLAKERECILQVGHQERVVAAAIGLDRIKARPIEVEIVRHSPRSNRNRDTSVVMDLMIHDLDLVNWLYGSPDWISTELAKSVYSDHLDHVRAELGYGQAVVRLSASRDAELQRYWILRYPDGTVKIDFGEKTLIHDAAYDLNADFGDSPDVKDSLAYAFEQFVKACLDGDAPLVSGDEGLAAVRLAVEIEKGT